MTTREFSRYVAEFGDNNPSRTVDEEAIKEVAQLISGSLVYRLYEAICSCDTYATTALNSGVAAQNVAKLLGHKDGATTLKFYAHYINTEAMEQLKSLEEQNVSHLGITAEELQRVVLGTESALEKSSVNERINEAIVKSKNMPPKKSVEQVLSVCEDILCQPLDSLTAQDKEELFGILRQYTAMKRRIAEQERMEKTKKPKSKER